MSEKKPAPRYNADDLSHFEGLDAVRKRPGMYIGSTASRGINHLFNEIIDNSTDEAGAGFATQIDVTLHEDGSIEVKDNGRGIPTGINAKTGMSGLEMVLTKLHAGGKFGGSGYKTAGGLHGVGASVVNALSLRMDATVAQDGKVQQISFQHGIPGVFDGDGPQAKFTKKPGIRLIRKMKRGESTGTTTRYWYDARYFDRGAKLSIEDMRDKIRNTAFLVPNVAYTLHDLTAEDALMRQKEEYCFPNGLSDMIDYLSEDSNKPICATVVVDGAGIFKEDAADENGVMQSNVERRCEVEISLRWGTGYDTTIECFTNTIKNIHGGTHRKGFDRGLTRAITEAIQNTRGLLKPKEELPNTDDVLEGLTAVIHVRVPEPQFTSQTKDELSTAGVTKVVQGLVEKTIKEWLNNRKTKNDAKNVLQKVVDASRVRTVQKQQKDSARRKTALEGASMPAKLVDCRATGVERSELFLVEGDSALGCFVGYTPVLLEDGNSIPIETLAKEWEMGYSYKGYAKNEECKTVKVQLSEPRMTKEVAETVKIHLSDGNTYECTLDHKIRVEDGSYVPAEKLKVGTYLMSAHEEADPFFIVNLETKTYENPIPVYDITVEEHHNFALGNGLIVHNSARKGRSSEYQALLPLRGKVLNVQKASLADAFANKEIESIIQVIGAGSGRTFEVDKMRYNRIIIMADADVDGSHIRCLLITLFAKYMRPVIESGKLYAAMPPLHKIVVKGKNARTIFTYTQEEMDRTVKKIEDGGETVEKPVARFKGLGEMDAEELWETTMDPSRRSIRRINIHDVEAAEKIVELCMGDNVTERRNYIIDNAHLVDEIDS